MYVSHRSAAEEEVQERDGLCVRSDERDGAQAGQTDPRPGRRQARDGHPQEDQRARSGHGA